MEETNKTDKTKEQVKEVTANKDTKNDIPNQVAGADNETIDQIINQLDEFQQKLAESSARMQNTQNADADTSSANPGGVATKQGEQGENTTSQMNSPENTQVGNVGNNSGSSVKPDIRKFSPSAKFSTPGIIITIVLLILSAVAWSTYNSFINKGSEVSQSEIISKIESGQYESITERNNYVVIEFKEEKEIDGRKIEVVTRNFSQYRDGSDQSFYDSLIQAGISKDQIKNYSYKPNTQITFGDVFIFIAFGAGIVMVFMLIRNMQSSGSKVFEFGQSKARLLFGKKVGITFKEVAGIDDAKEELQEVVDFLRNPRKYLDAGARIPRGVLLVGAPGTGKTMLAKAIAGEAGVPFFHTSGSEFEEMLVGAGASRVRDLFAKAKKTAPCIIFIDEIDAIAKKRGTVIQSGNTEQTLNQLLVEMDGLETKENVIVLGATNRPDVLDPAILRPGRFDRTVTVLMPDFEGRKAILDVHAKNKKFGKDVNMDIVAKKTVGYSGADLENLLNEAAIMSAKDNRKEIIQSDLMEAYLKVKLGRKKKNKVIEEDLKRFAYHEAGHAIVGKFTKNSDPVEQVSIIQRGMSGGVTVFVPDEDTKVETKSKLMAHIQHGVAGKIAEELFCDEMSSGSSSDIRMVTSVAKEMVQQYGMSERLGFVQYGNLDETRYLGYQYGGERNFSDKTALMIDQEVREIIETAQDNARTILKDHKNIVEKLVNMLLEKEVVDKDEFEKLFVEIKE
ncbi:MAG TPA: ATP-dependent zinc metalloprotease FtsH [Candidatus Dojkabacteria bacterium]|nr:ATP-dependent zinc metalloprotease FtsH [Candidatus Dojkabacteria bacterium]